MALLDAATIASAATRTFTQIPDATVGDRPVPTFRRADFKWRWLATRLHIFVFVVELPDLFPDEAVTALAESAREQSRVLKGGLPRGLQTGTAAMPIFIKGRWPAAALDWARQPQPVAFASILFPVLVAREPQQTAYRWKPQRMGRIYERFLRDQAESLVGPPSGYAQHPSSRHRTARARAH